MEELYHRQFACVCENCVMQKFEECFLPERNIVNFFLLPTFDKAKWHSFVANLKIPYLTQKTLRMILMMKCITRKQRHHCWLKWMILQGLKQMVPILTT